MRSKTLLLLLPVAFLTRCGQLETPAKPEPPKTIPVAGDPGGKTEKKTPARFWSEVRGLPQPNRYEVTLHWMNQTEPGENWLLYREDTNGMKHLTTLPKTTTSYTDSTVSAGCRYRYALATLRGAEMPIVDSFDLKTPQDLEIVGTHTLRQISGYQRLFLNPQSRIQTDGTDFRIDVEEILSDGGVISTFSPNQTAALGRNGRDGGSLSIRAKRASGILNVNVSGETGGEGVRGTRGTEGTRGMKGDPAELYIHRKRLPKMLDPHGEVYPKKIEEMLRKLPPTHPEFREYLACRKPPSDGKPGNSGWSGSNGYPGHRGGNTGTLYVEVLHPTTTFQVKVTGDPGAGGIGGRGGDGGSGGWGGYPGERDIHQICPPAGMGPMGSSGPQGQTGDTGISGSRNPYCLKYGGLLHGDCHKFPGGL